MRGQDRDWGRFEWLLLARRAAERSDHPHRHRGVDVVQRWARSSRRRAGVAAGAARRLGAQCASRLPGTPERLGVWFLVLLAAAWPASVLRTVRVLAGAGHASAMAQIGCTFVLLGLEFLVVLIAVIGAAVLAMALSGNSVEMPWAFPLLFGAIAFAAILAYHRWLPTAPPAALSALALSAAAPTPTATATATAPASTDASVGATWTAGAVRYRIVRACGSAPATPVLSAPPAPSAADASCRPLVRVEALAAESALRPAGGDGWVLREETADGVVLTALPVDPATIARRFGVAAVDIAPGVLVVPPSIGPGGAAPVGAPAAAPEGPGAPSRRAPGP